jgi:uncharacterized membrane protein (DUF485 family)
MAEKQYDWAAIAKNPKFVELHHKKRISFRLVDLLQRVYFLLPIGAAYAPGLFKIKMIGVINFGYVFALSQFFVSGAGIVLRHVANKDFDRLTKELIDELHL